jgi:hypothetical protein
MTQLTYNEAFDPYHAVFRFLRLHLACDISAKLPFDTLRILDFYLLFPFRLQAMKLFSNDTGWRKISKSYEDQIPYGAMPDDSTIFSRMEPFQRAAATSLVYSGHLVSDAWYLNEVQFTAKELPDAVTPARARAASSEIMRPALIVLPRPTSSANKVTGSPILPAVLGFKVVTVLDDYGVDQVPFQCRPVDIEFAGRELTAENLVS